jgi:hypothetical protein
MLNRQPVRGLPIEQPQPRVIQMQKEHGICFAQSARKHRQRGRFVNRMGTCRHGHGIYFWSTQEYRARVIGTVAQGPRKGLSGRMMD